MALLVGQSPLRSVAGDNTSNGVIADKSTYKVPERTNNHLLVTRAPGVKDRGRFYK
jgi:hypothetical protein